MRYEEVRALGSGNRARRAYSRGRPWLPGTPPASPTLIDFGLAAGKHERETGNKDARSESTRKSHWKWFQNALWTFLEQLDGGWPNQIFYAVANFLIILSVASQIIATTHISEFHLRIADKADLLSSHLRIFEEWVVS